MGERLHVLHPPAGDRRAPRPDPGGPGGSERRLPALGLSESQFGVLEILLHLGPLNQRGLGRKLFRSGGNITMVVDNLERRRLVRRERDASDRRHVRVSLTAEGRRLIRGVFPGHVAAIVRELRVLSAGEQEALGSLCKEAGLGPAEPVTVVRPKTRRYGV